MLNAPKARGVLLTLSFLMLSWTQAQEADSSLLFILDGSGSMWGQVEGETKIEIAKTVMTGLINDLPENISVGFQAYGHREEENCKDIELIAPLGSSKDELVAGLQSVTPTGRTPISGALEQAAATLDGVTGQKSIVLISDGLESCNADPCALMASLKEEGIETTVHIVGFDVGEVDQGQLQCIAEAGGGLYLSAQNTEELTQALTEVQEAVTEPAVTTVTVQTVKEGTLTLQNFAVSVEVHDQTTEEYKTRFSSGDGSEQFSTGTYSLQFHNQAIEDIAVTEGETTVVDADDYVGTLTVLNSQDNVDVNEQDSGEYITRLSDGESSQVLAGTYSLTVNRGGLPEVEVEAGETTTVDFASYVGTLEVVNLEGTADLNRQDTGDYTTRFRDGETQQVFAGSYSLDIGRGKLEDIEVNPGETTRLDLAAHTGWLVLEGHTKRIDVFNADGFAGAYTTDKARLQLLPGSYRVELENQSVDIEIKAGEELKLVLE